MNEQGPVFTARYRRGVVFAPGQGCFFAPLLIVPGATLFKNIVVAGAIVLGSFLLSSLAWSWLRRRRPALVLSREGMALEGMAFTPWSEIAAARRAVDARGRPAIVLRLKAGAPGFDMAPSPLWRPNLPDGILINALLLEDPVEETLGAFQRFLTRA